MKWEDIFRGRNNQKRCLISLRQSRVVQAVAVPIAPSPADRREHRKQLSERYGFQQIGEPLPDNVTLKDIIETLPKKVIVFLMFRRVLYVQ